MPKPSHKDTLITEGMRVIHEFGFNGASVRDIVKAAGVPHGSFTNHFASKEAFGLEVIDLYAERARGDLRDTLLNDDLKPLHRLGKYVDVHIRLIGLNDARNGCLLGNFAADSSDNDTIRARLNEIFAELERCVLYCLEAAVAARELRADTNCEQLATFIVSSMQGAFLLARTQRDPAPVVNLKEVLFSKVLQRA
ncbi:transcriptional regulator, TetR family [Paraburkholderia fungorum]|uniref:Transcriptional regulator, TetR family n=1 Tax=Paraburkholderia fungorum TaxID=134537 RepID=A0A1H1IRN3_9BURK|nr:TetR/AcrR family transcriptional regulator [Paraburkholderia fungorum]SDR40342.1 transcriptional regulator, TetR family [Paraburkholderia fungorum]